MDIQDAELKSFLESDVAIVVGTCDRDSLPAITRAWAARVTGDAREIQLFIGRTASQKTLENLAANRRVSATFSHPANFRTVQVKGWCSHVEEPEDGDQMGIERYQEAFIATVARYGLARDVILNIWAPDPVRLSLVPEFLFDQTPGPGAGRPL